MERKSKNVVAILEDKTDVHLPIRSLLQNADFSVLLVTNRALAEKFIVEKGWQVDAAIIGDGFSQFVESFKEMNPKTHIIGYTASDQNMKGANESMNRLTNKPEQLIISINQFLRRNLNA